MSRKFRSWTPGVALTTLFCHAMSLGGESLALKVEGRERVHYQSRPLSNPKGGERFKGSNFIHPLQTPSGFVVTDLQPDDHPHHFGLWWPWKYLEIGGRRVLCWELQEGDGLVRARESRLRDPGLEAISEYIDRRAPSGPSVLLNETAVLSTSGPIEEPARGYFLDVEIVHETAGDARITVPTNRYSGFSLRGAAGWNRNNSSLLTSAGRARDTANFTRARWVRVQGQADPGQTAGVLLMSAPDNPDHPENLRTWDQHQHDGAVFVNFNPVMDEPLILEPGKRCARRYRVFVYDGSISREAAEALWQTYASQPTDEARTR